MKNIPKFKKFLDALDDFEWQWLRLTIEQAFMIDRLQKRYKLSDKDFANKLGISRKQLSDIKKGSVDLDLKFLARVELFAKEQLLKEEMFVVKD